MAGRLRLAWLPRCLFWSSLAAAGVLAGLVFLAPLLDNAMTRPVGWRARLLLAEGKWLHRHRLNLPRC